MQKNIRFKIPKNALEKSAAKEVCRIAESGGKIGVACSGGADSVCALMWVAGVFSKNKKNVYVLHFNHRERAAADSDAEFDKGAGLYTGTGIPGEGRTIISGAHTNTYYRDLESVEEGDEILVSTRYGDYKYRVTGTRVATDTDTTAYDLEADHENLVLYTCYPFGTTQYTDERYFVYADLTEGPAIVDGAASSAASDGQ